MADDEQTEKVHMFCAFTSATPTQAQQYLVLTDGNVEQAVELYFNSPELGAAPTTTRSDPTQLNNPITIDDDDDDVQETGSRTIGGSTEDDEAMARRLQEEMYGSGNGNGGGGGMMGGEEDIRAPMARTTETLVGPDADWRDDPGQMNAAIAEQLMARRQHAQRAGIFNQRAQDPSIWSEEGANPSTASHREALSRATGGASEATSKSNLLADLFRPPFDLISPLPNFSSARDEGKAESKWILVNVQDPSIFDCQVLNRDIWKNSSIRDTIRAHFIFLQYSKHDPRGQEYVNYYFSHQRDSEDSYPHIAIVDPRTGEQVKVWSGSPGPKASDFLMDLHEFLDRYSLVMGKRNPVQGKKKERRKDVAQMSEEEMLEMAMRESVAGGTGSGEREDEDPDALTKEGVNGKGKEKVSDSEPEAMDTSDTTTPAPATTNGSSAKEVTPFSLISSTSPHTEPSSTDPKQTTRIQFRYSGGRVVRRFSLDDTVRRLYEWLKAEPLEGHDGKGFELICSGRNLIGVLDQTIKEAGVGGGTVMVEFVDEGEEE